MPAYNLSQLMNYSCQVGATFKHPKLSCLLSTSAEAAETPLNLVMLRSFLLFFNQPVLCDVICLKKLSITYYHQLSALPNGIGKLVNLVVLRLGSCTDLSELLQSIRSLHKLCILDISDCLSIRHLPKDVVELCNLKSST
ncbi:hypothetical protein ACB094_12G013600 [Castanea mollissima]